MDAVRVTIFHQQYSLMAAEDPAEVERLAQEVDELMTSIAQRAGNVDATRVAVLASLHLADRLRSIERKLRESSLLLDQAMSSRA